LIYLDNSLDWRERGWLPYAQPNKKNVPTDAA